ncbi:phospholipase D-like domain-containing protein [Echinimonas agarilytica]|uniref:phospholipase D n=1 Tax=Echinimonas agarilytica TaxID=1215918 RepID=A0AA41W861_9GAMM|nr:phospholipase D-like domain-containing protein [Echinimonas agarilytica]MCM2680626.1 phospholipase D-like domain-containing protein [Echinimonas agarilytica]
MGTLVQRIIELANDIREFPLGKCSPSDDPDMQSAYTFAFRDIAKRFIGSVKRIDNDLIQNEVKNLDPDIEYIHDAYNLKSDLLNIIDIIEDLQNEPDAQIGSKVKVTPGTANKLLGLISDHLYDESAYVLPMVCTGYGLQEGEVSEAFSSKRNYIYARTCHLKPDEIYELALKMQGKYGQGELERIISDIQNNSDRLNVISEFENIKKLIVDEIRKAEFCIWVAVAWFTDKDLANLLYFKKKEGLNIQLIINDDHINFQLGEKLGTIFETYKIPENSRKLMHNKFCIIDLKKVIHGSYNWTNKAQYNNETVSIIENKAIAENFAKQFIALKTNLR